MQKIYIFFPGDLCSYVHSTPLTPAPESPEEACENMKVAASAAQTRLKEANTHKQHSGLLKSYLLLTAA